MTTLTCNKCNREKPTSEFYYIGHKKGRSPTGRSAYRSQCKECDRAHAREKARDPAYKAKRMERLRAYRTFCTEQQKPDRGTQVCTVCKIEKHLDQFHRDKGVLTGRNTRCKECVLKRLKAKYYESTWGIDNEIINQKLKEQNGQCMICGKTTKLVLDHDHIGKQVRDFLCNNCNSGLGYFGDSIETIEKALNYLIKHRDNPHALKADINKRRNWETRKYTRKRF